MKTCWHRNTFHITGPLWWESTSHWWFLLTKGQWCEPLMFSLLLPRLLCCLWCWHEQAVEHTVKWPVIRDAVTLMWFHYSHWFWQWLCSGQETRHHLNCWPLSLSHNELNDCLWKISCMFSCQNVLFTHWTLNKIPNIFICFSLKKVTAFYFKFGWNRITWGHWH